jgi:type II secretory pathway pseudopilin PulG
MIEYSILYTSRRTRRALAATHRRRGQSLIGLLVVMVIIVCLYMLFLGKRTGENGETKESVLVQSMEKGSDTATSSNIAQIQMAVEMYKNDNDGKPPASLDELKNGAYGRGYPAEMWVDSVSKRPLNYDPQTGRISSPTGGLPGVPGSAGTAPPASDMAPGGVDLSGVPGIN